MFLEHGTIKCTLGILVVSVMNVLAKILSCVILLYYSCLYAQDGNLEESVSHGDEICHTTFNKDDFIYQIDYLTEAKLQEVIPSKWSPRRKLQSLYYNIYIKKQLDSRTNIVEIINDILENNKDTFALALLRLCDEYVEILAHPEIPNPNRNSVLILMDILNCRILKDKRILQDGNAISTLYSMFSISNVTTGENITDKITGIMPVEFVDSYSAINYENLKGSFESKLNILASEVTIPSERLAFNSICEKKRKQIEEKFSSLSEEEKADGKTMLDYINTIRLDSEIRALKDQLQISILSWMLQYNVKVKTLTVCDALKKAVDNAIDADSLYMDIPQSTEPALQVTCKVDREVTDAIDKLCEDLVNQNLLEEIKLLDKKEKKSLLAFVRFQKLRLY